MIDELLQWCEQAFTRPVPAQRRMMCHRYAAALIVGYGIPLPHVAHRISDTLLHHIISLVFTNPIMTWNADLYHVLAAVLTHLWHRDAVQSRVEEALQSSHDRSVLFQAMASSNLMDITSLAAMTIVPTILNQPSDDDDVDEATLSVAARWLGEPNLRSALWNYLHRAYRSSHPAHKARVFAALTNVPHTPDIFALVFPLIKRGLASSSVKVQKEALAAIGHWAGFAPTTPIAIDEVNTTLAKASSPRDLAFAAVRAYRNMALTGYADEETIGRVMDWCRTFFPVIPLDVCGTLGRLLQSRSPSVARQALATCHDFLRESSYLKYDYYIISALCRGLTGPAAEEVEQTIEELIDHNPTQNTQIRTNILSIITTFPRFYEVDARAKQRMVTIGTRLLRQYKPPIATHRSIWYVIRWIVTMLPPHDALVLLSDIPRWYAGELPMDDPAVRIPSLMARIIVGDDHERQRAWDEITTMLQTNPHEIMPVVTKEWLHGIAIAPPDIRSWLVQRGPQLAAISRGNP
jgi:hypothetical protein